MPSAAACSSNGNLSKTKRINQARVLESREKELKMKRNEKLRDISFLKHEVVADISDLLIRL